MPFDFANSSQVSTVSTNPSRDSLLFGMVASGSTEPAKFTVGGIIDEATAQIPEPVQNILFTTAGQTITGGFNFTPYNAGTKSSGTFTPDPLNGNYQFYTNSGAHILAAPASDCAIDILVTNSGAGTITFSGYTVGQYIGDPYVTTSGYKFIISIRRINGTSTYSRKALQ